MASIKKSVRKRRRSKTLVIYLDYLMDSMSIIETYTSIYPNIINDINNLEPRIKAQDEKITRIIKRNQKSTKISNTKLKNLISNLEQIRELSREKDRLRRSARTLSNAMFVNLFSRYDAFLIDLIKFYYSKNNLILESDKSLKFSEIIESGVKNIKDLKQRFIDAEIEQFRSSRINQIKFFEKITNTKILNNSKTAVPIFIEASERRNIIVHHDGKITPRYRTMLRQYGVKQPETNNINQLNIDIDYMNSVNNALFKITSEIGFALNRGKKSKENILSEMNNEVVVKAMSNQQYPFALNVLDILEEHGLEMRLILINKALCYKLSGSKSKLKSILVEFDNLNVDENIYRLAKLLIVDDVVGAIELIKSVNDLKQLNNLDNEITYGHSKDILFTSFVSSEEYRKCIRSQKRKLKAKN